jgi:hypothetical protein
MPIVFVHGVNNRNGDEYRDNEAGRNGFLREIVAPALGLPPKELYLANPYWGGDAAQFAWNMAVLPDASENYRQFGAGEETEALGRTIELVSQYSVHGGVVDNARRDFAKTVDLLYGATLAGAKTEDEARLIATSYRQAVQYTAANPSPTWLETVSDENFADVLNSRVHADDEEMFGAGGFLDQLKEGLSRLSNALPSAGTELLGRLARKKLNVTVTRFAGDAFVYLTKRGTPQSPGPIVDVVLKAIREAAAQKTAHDPNLVVIAHSFGGEIVYDILTHFATDLEIDVLITVGSQVALFEEMKLYIASSATIPPNPPDGKVPKPANLKRWLNVFDTNDVLSFRVEPVFSDAHDFLYDTGYSAFQAHGGYFLQPSFYARLAARLSAPDPKQARDHKQS